MFTRRQALLVDMTDKLLFEYGMQEANRAKIPPRSSLRIEFRLHDDDACVFLLLSMYVSID